MLIPKLIQYLPKRPNETYVGFGKFSDHTYKWFYFVYDDIYGFCAPGHPKHKLHPSHYLTMDEYADTWNLPYKGFFAERTN